MKANIIKICSGLLLAGIMLPTVSWGATVTWTGGTNGAQSINLTTATNYTPTADFGTDILTFDTPTNPDMRIAGGASIYGLAINAGGSGFTLRGTTGGVQDDTLALTVQQYGVSVADSTIATLNTRLARHGTLATSLNVSVGANGRLNLNNLVNFGAAPVNKNGSGTLYMGLGSTNASGATVLNINEGTLELGSSAVIKYNTGSLQTLPVHLGTASTSARLTGSGSIKGTLNTYGAARSTIDATMGTLDVSNISASSGANFVFNLENSYRVQGSGSFTGENLTFDLLGGTAGEVYTLFHYDSYTLDTGSFVINTAGYTLDATFGTGGWLVNGSDLQVRFTAVPEPSTLLLVVMGSFALHLMRRRRHALV